MWRRGIMLMLMLATLSGTGYGAYWFWVKTQLEGIVANWFEDWAAAGYEAGYVVAGAEGFPMTVRLRLRDVVLSDPGDTWRWAGQGAAVEVRPWEPTAYRLELTGTHDLGVPIAGRRIDTVAHARSAVGIARTDLDGRLRYAAIDLHGFVLDAPALQRRAAAERLALELKLPPEPPARHDQLFGEALVAVDRLTLPAGYHGPLGPDLERLSVRLQLLGPIKKAETEAMLAAWRDAGGVVDIPWFRLDWGPLRLDGDGTVTLDAFFRPQGAFAGRLTGIDPTVKRFVEAGLINRTMGSLISAGLQLMAVTPDDGGPAYVPTSIEAQDGSLYLGAFKIGDLAPVIPKPREIDRAAPAPSGSVTVEEITEPRQ